MASFSAKIAAPFGLFFACPKGKNGGLAVVLLNEREVRLRPETKVD